MRNTDDIASQPTDNLLVDDGPLRHRQLHGASVTVAGADRHLHCAGVFNLRDLGGYPTADGRTTRWRTLFRADGLHRAEPGDAILRGISWRTVLDLRTAAERDAGHYASDGVDTVHLPVLRDAWDADALAAETEDAAKFLTARYLEMAEVGAPAIAAAFELLAASARLPAVFHCSAGKDRTGVLAALVLDAMGVEDDVIAADYHLSAVAMDRLVAWVRTTRPEIAEHMARQPAAFLECPPEAILGFLNALRARHGSARGYLHDIGISHETVDTLRHVLLEET